MAMLGAEPRRLHFPESAEVPESKRHLELRTLLYQFLKLAFGNVAAVGCDQFVYWDPTDPRACLAPDAFVRFDAKNDQFRSRARTSGYRFAARAGARSRATPSLTSLRREATLCQPLYRGSPSCAEPGIRAQGG